MFPSLFELLQWLSIRLWQASWQASVLAALILVIQFSIGRRLSASWRNALWLVVFARLLMPGLPQARFSAYNWVPNRIPHEIAAISRTIAPTAAPTAAPIPSKPVVEPGVNSAAVVHPTPLLKVNKVGAKWDRLLPLGWGIGFLFAFASGVVGYFRLSRRITTRQKVVPASLKELFDQARAELKVENVELFVSEAGHSPFLTGFWRKRVVLPAFLPAALTTAEMRMVLLHELGHVKRGDLWITWLAWFAGTLHWFNPAIRWALSQARKDRELACDEWVLRRVDDSATYGSTLLRFLELNQGSLAQLGAVGIFESKSALVNRLRLIARYRRPSLFGSVAGIALLCSMGALTLTRASVSALTAAASENAIEAAKVLFQAGADPNELDELGQTPLFQALAGDHVEMVRLLLDHGARLDILDKHGFTPLADAAQSHSPECIKLLIERGADINFKHPVYVSLFATAQHFVGEDALDDKDKERRYVFKNALKTVEALLDKGVDINVPGIDGMSPLSKAAANGQTAIFNLLLQRGADVNQRDDQGGTPLIRAIMPGFGDKPRLAMMDQLFAKGADIKIGTDNPNVKDGIPSPLKAVLVGGISGGSPDPAKLEAAHSLIIKLLKHGAGFALAKDSDAEKLLLAATTGDLDTVQQLLARGVSPDSADTKGWTPLMSASALGESSIMKALIDAGANVSNQDASGLTPLWLAISTNPNRADIQLLLDKGADVNAKADFHFGPLLKIAVMRNVPTIVEELLKRGANPNVTVDGTTPLHSSVWAEHGNAQNAQIAKLLLDYGADPNPKCYENRSPLYWAVSHNMVQTVKELLNAGADPAKVDDYQYSILDTAGRNGEIRTCLEAALKNRRAQKPAQK